MKRAALATVLLAFAAASHAGAQGRSHLGAHLGINTDFEDFYIGAHGTFPLTRYLELYPSFDVYFPDDGTLLGFNGDFKFLIPTKGNFNFYAGPGLGILYSSFDDEDDTSVGLNFFGGIESRRGQVHPFLEVRALVHDNSSFQFAFGLNFTLGQHTAR
jgi:hypothetical protein